MAIRSICIWLKKWLKTNYCVFESGKKQKHFWNCCHEIYKLPRDRLLQLTPLFINFCQESVIPIFLLGLSKATSFTKEVALTTHKLKLLTKSLADSQYVVGDIMYCQRLYSRFFLVWVEAWPSLGGDVFFYPLFLLPPGLTELRLVRKSWDKKEKKSITWYIMYV